jgi:hypothetical protein
LHSPGRGFAFAPSDRRVLSNENAEEPRGDENAATADGYLSRPFCWIGTNDARRQRDDKSIRAVSGFGYD